MLKGRLVAIAVLCLGLLLIPYVAKAPPGESSDCPTCLPGDDTPITPFTTLAQYGGYMAAGVGLRNTGTGTITIAGIPATATVTNAYLYWAIIDYSPMPPGLASATFASNPINGTLIGTDVDPCWPPNTIYAFRADVTSYVTGNGAYIVTIASGLIDGSNPWGSGGSPIPEAEGASLVVVFSDPASPYTNIVIHEGAVTHWGITWPTVTMPHSAAISTSATTTYIIADGQISGNDAIFNGATIATNVFQGSDPHPPGWSYGGLWDTTTFPVSVAIGSTSETATISSGPDCLTWIVQVLAVQTEAPAGVPETPFAIPVLVTLMFAAYTLLRRKLQIGGR